MPELRTHLMIIGIAGQSRTAVLLCAGRMDHASLEALRAALAAAVDTGAPVVEIDLRKVSHIERCAAAALLIVHSEMASARRELRLVAGPGLAALLRRLGADAILTVQTSGDAAHSWIPRQEQNRVSVRSRRTEPPESEKL